MATWPSSARWISSCTCQRETGTFFSSGKGKINLHCCHQKVGIFWVTHWRLGLQPSACGAAVDAGSQIMRLSRTEHRSVWVSSLMPGASSAAPDKEVVEPKPAGLCWSQAMPHCHEAGFSPQGHVRPTFREKMQRVGVTRSVAGSLHGDGCSLSGTLDTGAHPRPGPGQVLLEDVWLLEEINVYTEHQTPPSDWFLPSPVPSCESIGCPKGL